MSDDADFIQLSQLLQQLYYPLFSFYLQIITHAGEAFNNFKENIKSPPDTALLIAFVQLMEVQQQQLNTISQRHLDFYYQDILKQSSKPACADEAYLCVKVKATAQEFLLPAGTQFNAGLNAQQQPLIYATTQPYLLNKATLKYVKTLCYASPPGGAVAAPSAKKLWFNRIETPAELKKGPQGQLLSWPLLGESAGVELNQGFAFASPMLAMQNAERTLSISLEWAENTEVKDDYFNGSTVYLSTKDGWFLVNPNLDVKPNESGWSFKSNTFVIKLGVTAPPIAALTENPDGYACRWPLFKLVLGDKNDLTVAPVLKSLTIKTEVREFGAFELYNDFGKLEQANGGLPFGPIPAQGANFYLGSAEIFAKPLTNLELNVKWLDLPAFMQDYYWQYNELLLKLNVEALCRFMAALAHKQKILIARTLSIIFVNHLIWPFIMTSKDLGTCEDILINAIPRLSPVTPATVQSLLNTVAAKLKDKNPLGTFQPPYAVVFDNHCFKVSFSIWRHSQEQNIAAENTLEYPASQAQETSAKPGLILLFVEQAPVPRYALRFLDPERATDSVSEATRQSQAAQPLATASVFQIDPASLRRIKPAPDLLEQPLLFSISNKIGFLSMKLEQPGFGFGNILYAQVVQDICQENAYLIVKKRGKYAPIPMPNAPYVPKISQLNLSYAAEQKLDFSSTQQGDDYPFEFYHYDCFGIYPVFDGNGLRVNQRQTPNLLKTDQAFRLFAGLGATACLYLCVADLQPPCQLTLYFELSHFVALQANDTPQPPELYFYYLADSGWKTLSVLSDDTDQLSGSGIVEMVIPNDIGSKQSLLPKDGYWLAIATNSPSTGFARAVFLTSQAIKVKRLPPLGMPSIAAGQIKAPLTPVAEIDAVNQPFASFNGLAAEESHTYYQRVSQRVKNKDRACSKADFELMALKALPGLYYCKLISPQGINPNPGEISLGLVNGYDDPSLPDAFKPVLNRRDLDKIRRYFAARISPFVQLKLFNLSHETVTVTAGIKFAATVAINRTCKEISQQLKVYLSPWLQSAQTQINIDAGLSSAEINGFLAGLPGVEKVCSLSLSTTESQYAENQFILYPKYPYGLFVSAEAHNITAVSVC